VASALRLFEIARVKYWQITAHNLSKAGWNCSCIVSMDSEGRDIFVVIVHGDGQRFIVRADEKLTPFLELQSGICAGGELA
jgi:hypothetical protein